MLDYTVPPRYREGFIVPILFGFVLVHITIDACPVSEFATPGSSTVCPGHCINRAGTKKQHTLFLFAKNFSYNNMVQLSMVQPSMDCRFRIPIHVRNGQYYSIMII